MVAPRTRAERPADIVPAARPARKGSRRPAANGTDGSPPKRTRSKANGASTNGVEAAHPTTAPPTTAKAAPTTAKAGPTAAKAAPTAAKPAKRSSLEALGEQLIASVLRHDDDADVEDVRRAIEFAIEAHGEQKRASGEPYVTHPI